LLVPDPSYILLAFTVLIMSLSVHEAAHAWSADLLGDPTPAKMGRLSFNPLVHVDPIGTILFPLVAIATGQSVVGWAKPLPVAVSELGVAWRRKVVLIAAAGPASNVGLALVAAGLWHSGVAATGTNLDRPLAQLLSRGLTINVLLAVLNLLPVPPLDGGNALAKLLRGKAAAALDRARPYGVLVLYVLLLTGALATVVQPVAYTIVSWLN
jgi:Zn-dependent protease